jgi:hypothetical protein
MLALAGRLDDSRDFDSPRERFRRFLREYVPDIATARALIDQARYSPDDQHRRALQDLVVLVGRFLGFDVDIGAPPLASGAPAHHGTWHAHGRLHVLVEVGTFTGAAAVPSAGALAGSSRGVAGGFGSTTVRLFVPTSLPVAEQARAASGDAVRVMPIAELLSLADLAATGRLAMDEIARVFEFGIPIDFVSGLLNRQAADAASAATASAPTAAAPPAAAAPAPAVPADGHAGDSPAARRGSGYWMASVPPDYATTPEEFLELVVARRHVFGVTDRGTVVGTVQTGDGICFFLPGKGVVGHAWVASMTDGANDLRDARRFRQVLRLERLSLHLNRPTPLDLETEVRLRAAPRTANRSAQMLLEISPDSFRTLIAPARPADRPGAGDDDSDERSTAWSSSRS